LRSIREQCRNPGSRRHCETAFAKELRYAFERTGNPLAGGIFIDAKRLADIAQAAFFEETQQQGKPITVSQVEQRLIEQWHQGFQRRAAFALNESDLRRGFFAPLTAQFLTHSRLRFEDRGAMQPTGQRLDSAQARRFAGQRHKNILSDFLCRACIANLPQRCGKNEIDMAGDQRTKGVLRAFGGIGLHQLGVWRIRRHRSLAMLPPRAETGQPFSEMIDSRAALSAHPSATPKGVFGTEGPVSKSYP
jgi:hypothetical protein